MLNSKPAASELCAISFFMVWPYWPDIYQCSCCNQTALILYYMLLRRHHRRQPENTLATLRLPFPRRLRLKQSSYPDVSSPLQTGSYHQLSHHLILLSWEVETGGQKNMTEQDPGKLTHKHIFILQLKFLRGFQLRVPLETSKGNKADIIVPYVGQYSKVQSVIPSGRQDRACVMVYVCVCVNGLNRLAASRWMTSNLLWSYPP